MCVVEKLYIIVINIRIILYLWATVKHLLYHVCMRVYLPLHIVYLRLPNFCQCSQVSIEVIVLLCHPLSSKKGTSGSHSVIAIQSLGVCLPGCHCSGASHPCTSGCHCKCHYMYKVGLNEKLNLHLYITSSTSVIATLGSNERMEEWWD